MYNDNDRSKYEYHYSYRPNYSEPLPTTPSEPTVTEKPKKKRRGLRIAAGILCAALLVGGAFSAGYFLKDGAPVFKNETNAEGEAIDTPKNEIYLSDREGEEITMVSVTGTEKLTLPEIYAANVDSCVSINVSATAYNFFGQPVQSASSGSGFIITESGYIVTNYHVISGGTTVEVTLNNGSIYSAELVGGDQDYDIAVIKIDPGKDQLKPVVLGSSEELLVGEDIIAIGNPLGELTFSMSEGIVSCLDRSINVDGTPFNMIQITAAVNSGNSGGPLFNTYGEVVGIVSAKYSTSQSGAAVEGLGFAIPMDDVLYMIKDIMEHGQVTTRPYMGVSVSDAYRYPECGMDTGAYIAEVVEGGPAEKAGLKEGDVITMVGTTTISTYTDVTAAVGSKSYSAGDSVTITFVRSGKVYTTELTFGSTLDMPAQDSGSQQVQPYPSNPSNGYYGGDMDEFFDRYFNRGN